MQASTRALRVVYVGPPGGTCRHRAQALRSLGHEVRHVASDAPASPAKFLVYRVLNRLKRPPDMDGASGEIERLVAGGQVDLLWIDKGRSIRPSTLARVRRDSPATRIVAYSPDDMLNPDNQSVRYLRAVPLYDLHVTTKSYNVAELQELGARDVLFVDNAYDPESHRPLPLDAEDRARYEADTGFIGGYEADRAEQMLALARAGIACGIWGYHWDRWGVTHERLDIKNELLDGDDYAKCIVATRINLGFLRKVNRDLQTTRSIEIPACGGFLMAERTDEHLRLFEEGREAEFFGSVEELVQKCRYYLEHEEKRRQVAEAGRRRCVEGGYSNQDRLKQVIDHLAERHGLGSAQR